MFRMHSSQTIINEGSLYRVQTSALKYYKIVDLESGFDEHSSR